MDINHFQNFFGNFFQIPGFGPQAPHPQPQPQPHPQPVPFLG
ncbi:hypothetical protein [Rhodococcus sp. NPDC003348]